MSGRARIVVRPAELGRVAIWLDAAGDDVSQSAKRLRSLTYGVRLNNVDPQFSVGGFHERRYAAGLTLDGAALGSEADARITQLTVDEAVAADSGGPLAALDRVALTIVAQPPSNQSGVFHDELIGRRSELLTEISNGSRAGFNVLEAYIASGGSVVELFGDVAGTGGSHLQQSTYYMAAEGRVGEAQELDRALAVARLLVSDESNRPLPGSASGAVTEFDRFVTNGVDVTVAANAVRLNTGLPDSSELRSLVDRLTVAFAPGDGVGDDGGSGSLASLTEEQQAWLPFSMRLRLSDNAVTSSGPVNDGTLQSSIYDGRFLAGSDEISTRVAVVGELGRTGLDGSRGGEVLAGELTALVLPSEGWPADLRTHRAVSSVVGDPTVGVDAAFFEHLGADGTAVLADVVWAVGPFAMSQAGSSGTAADVLARYGDGMAAADSRGELAFAAQDLFGVDGVTGAAAAAGYYLGADTAFSRKFAVQSAAALIDAGRDPGSYGVGDPRGMAIHQVTHHGGEASVELFDLLGEDFLDDLLWNAEPIESSELVHPVYRLFIPVLDDSRLRPSLAADLVITAGREHADQDAELYTGDVIQHAFLGDKFLLAPEEAYRLGGANSTGYGDLFPGEDDVVNAVEIVYASGSGDGFTQFENDVIFHIAYEALNVEGAARISDDTIGVYRDILSSISSGEFNAGAKAALSADARINRAKYVGAAVSTALPGALPLKTAASVGTGVAVNLGSGPLFDQWEADHYVRHLENNGLELRMLGGTYRAQMAYALAALGSVNLTYCPQNDLDVGHLVVTSADGTPSGILSDWLRTASDLHSREIEDEGDSIRFSS